MASAADITVPPTAGLPPRAGDLWAWRDADLGAALARFLGTDAAEIACSGTAAFVAALTALRRLAPGRDTVVVPAYTCPLVALAVAHCGLQLRCCDLRPSSLDLDPQALAALCGDRTLAIVPTHLGGRVVDLAPALAIARACGAFVIEDAAQALGARAADGRSVGLAGDIGFFSLAVGKGLTLFEGGVLVARDAKLQAACRSALADVTHGGTFSRCLMDARRSVELLGYHALYRPSALSWAYRRPLRSALAHGDWTAAAGDDFDPAIPLHRVGRWRRAVGVQALRRLPAFLAEAQARAHRRTAQLAGLPGLRTVLHDSPAGARGTWPVLLVLLDGAARRDGLLRDHWGDGNGLSVPFVRALPDYARYRACVPPAASEELPHARDLAARLLAISNSPWLDDERFARLCALLRHG
ncbi:DegT/DnrJ/EryC1/StrS family aminotransferase [Xylophilus sp.]|uniref:DegT/DnrJ/EryC1/StrS family aminotransferase n=1 Tax=Xylophilus sp. TaxID=2653893 RepID=UPI0013B6722D|nr:DegT/DnrJ/EryC1/StrS family aminotransferase [Xylophilus sp.]KAF1047891.1 MAG: GDP-perosamine synthase [Xylophilus sp.]